MHNATSHFAEIPVTRDNAFRRFVDEIDTWWPAEYTWAGKALQELTMGAHVGGLCSEIGPHGFRCDWGRVLAIHRPERIVLAWQIGPDRLPVPDPERASEVEVRFREAEDGTSRLELEHRSFSRHGEGAADYLAAMSADHGWPYILSRYKQSFQ